MLTGLSGDRDPDDLAWAALKDQNITNADEVAWNDDGVSNWGSVVEANSGAVSVAWWTASVDVDIDSVDIDVAVTHFNIDVLLYNAVMVMMTWAVNRVQHVVCRTAQTAGEGMVLAFVVVVAHTSVITVCCPVFGDLDSLVNSNWITLCVLCCCVFTGVGALVLPPTRLSVLLIERYGAVSVITLSYVDAGVEFEIIASTIVDAVLNVDINVSAASIRFTVAITQPLVLLAMTAYFRMRSESLIE